MNHPGDAKACSVAPGEMSLATCIDRFDGILKHGLDDQVERLRRIVTEVRYSIKGERGDEETAAINAAGGMEPPGPRPLTDLIRIFENNVHTLECIINDLSELTENPKEIAQQAQQARRA